jgi:hypothetical protein
MKHVSLILIPVFFLLINNVSAVSAERHLPQFTGTDGSMVIQFSQDEWQFTLDRQVDFKRLYFEPFVHDLQLSVSFNYLHQMQRFAYNKKENPIRRVEILFFGSLTLVSFLGWLFFSMMNVMIYEESFGILQREQVLWLYLGSSVISLSISISDLLINLRPKIKKIEIY